MNEIAQAHLGEALGTDFFSVREQFTHEQWEKFSTARKFVDSEVIPVAAGYWERAEMAWPLIRRLPELGVVGEDIEGYGCAGMSPLACGLVTMELHRGSDSIALETTAEPDGEDWILTGRKRWIGLGTHADLN